MKRIALALLLLLALGAQAKELPFVADDHAKATAIARAKNLPIFVEAWAPW